MTIADGHSPHESVSVLCTDKATEFLFSADTGGYIQCWRCCKPTLHRTRSSQYDLMGAHSRFHSETLWQAYVNGRSVSCIDVIESNDILDTFVVTASTSPEVRVWTYTGALVGSFGSVIDLQRLQRPLQLHNRSAYGPEPEESHIIFSKGTSDEVPDADDDILLRNLSTAEPTNEVREGREFAGPHKPVSLSMSTTAN